MKLQEQEPTTELKPLNVVIDGKIVGEVRPSHGTKPRWHAAIKAGGNARGTEYTLIQGFADDPDQAVAKAIEEGKAAVRRDAKNVAEFTAAVTGQSVEANTDDRLVAADLLEERGFYEAAKVLRDSLVEATSV